MSRTRCLMCGMSMLTDAKSYEQHIETYHSLDGYSVKIKPINTSGRTKAQIVADMEKGVLAPYITELAPRPTVVSPKDVPAAFCLPQENICVWEKHGLDLCAPCATRKEYLAKTAVAQ